MGNNELTYTQLDWIVQALNHYVAYVRDEMDKAPDGSPILAFGEIVIDSRSALATKIKDISVSKHKTIRLK